MSSDFIMKLENITEEKWNEMISTGWKLMSVDHFVSGRLIYSFVKN